MLKFSKNDALSAYWKASPANRQIILQEARESVTARQAAMIALEQRVAQAVAALFAAAAFSATFAVSFQQKDWRFSLLGGLATIGFTAGALISLLGMRAGDITFPGASPSWWKDADFLKSRSNKDAQYWVVGNLELVIESYDKVARRRANALNAGLLCGVVGGLLVAIAGALAICG